MLIDWFTVIAQVVNFLILVYLLKRFLYKPILNAIDEREKRIAMQLQEAAEEKEEAEDQHQKYRQLNEELDKNKKDLMAQAKTEAENEHQRLLEGGRREYEGLRSHLQESLKKEQANLRQDLQQRAQTEIFEIARKVLTNLADTSLESQIVQVFIQKLENMGAEEKAQFSANLQPADSLLLVRSAFELNPEQQQKMESAIEKNLGKKGRLEFRTAPEELGGIELSGNGFKLAWNINDYLDTLEKRVAGLSEEMQAK